MDCGAEWVVGCSFGHCQNGSCCQGQNPVHLKGFDGHFQIFAHHDSGLLVESVYGLEDQEHLDGNNQGALCRRGCA